VSVVPELVGISKLTKKSLDQMSFFAEQAYAKKDHSMHYEDALIAITRESKLHVTIISDLAWCEIDDPSHSGKAVSIVYPKIQERA
jgi:choline kinase